MYGYRIYVYGKEKDLKPLAWLTKSIGKEYLIPTLAKRQWMSIHMPEITLEYLAEYIHGCLLILFSLGTSKKSSLWEQLGANAKLILCSASHELYFSCFQPVEENSLPVFVSKNLISQWQHWITTLFSYMETCLLFIDWLPRWGGKGTLRLSQALSKKKFS